MTERERRKKEWELKPCHLLAKEINRRSGTDYEAGASDEGLADALLRSVSGKHPDVPVQVVSIPLDWRHRDDKHSLAKTREAVTAALLKRGLEHCSISLVPTTKAEARKMPGHLVEQLAELVLDGAARGIRQLNYTQIGAYSSGLPGYFDYISIFCHPAIPRVTVEIASGTLLPPDGRWIEEGIAKKLEKYGGPAAVKDLTLVMDVANIIDDEQIASFKATHVEKALPFSEIWILGLQGIVCLKSKSS
jgi:hypothetical protein